MMSAADKKKYEREIPNLESDLDELLNTEKINLANGKTHPMFAKFPSKAFSIYLCFPCAATCSGEKFLQSHLKGRKHNYHKNRVVWPESIITNHPYLKMHKETSAESLLSLNLNLIVAPGEPVPPGIEVESQLERMLKDHKKPLVGLEYMVEIIHEVKFEPGYFCSLCDCSMNFLNIVISHLDGFRHKQKYITINYPSAFRRMYEMTLNNKSELHPGFVKVLNNICKCIEEAYGRLKPLVLNQIDFESDRIKYIKQIHQGKHFSEKDGGTFEELVDLDYMKIISETSGKGNKIIEIDCNIDEKAPNTSEDSASIKKKKDKKDKNNVKGKRRSNSLDSISSLSIISEDNDVYVVLDSTEEKSVEGKEIQISIPAPRKRIYRNKLGRSSDEERESTPLLDEVSSKDSLMSNVRSKSGGRPKRAQWEVYRSKMKEIVDEAKEQLEYHEKFPEKHPQYDEEWKKFWSKSYRNFEIEKKDIWQYDLKPDWIKCWRKIMLDMHNETLAIKRRELLKELQLLSDDESDKPKSTEGSSRRKAFVNYDSKNNDRMRRDRDSSRDRNFRASPRRNRDRDIDKNRVNRRDRPYDDKRRDRSLDRDRDNNRKRDRDDDRRGERNRSRDRNERDSKIRRRQSPSPRRDNRKRSSNSIPEDDSTERARWNKYHKKMNDFMVDITKIYRKHEDSPVYHPLFTVEYDKFKNRKIKEDPFVSMDSSSVQAEWSKFWVAKLKSFKSEEILMKKKSIIKELDLKIIKDGVYYPEESMDIYKECEPIKSRSPPKTENRSQNRHENKITQEELKDLNVVIVLRHLTALENYLGSLGPKIVDLLGTALKMEKVKPNSSEDILACDEYCVLLETVKEKLKGQLIAKLIESHAEPAAKLAITYVASMIHKASKIAEEKKIETEKKAKDTPVTVAGIGAVEKAAIANQIANALVAQGKTDVTTEELEYLINAVVGIANASESSNKSLFNNFDLLAQLTEKRHRDDQKMNEDIKNGLEMLQTAYDKNVKTSNPPAPIEKDSLFDDRLNDSDLKTLLQNFKHLSADEQHGLINYLKKLEARDSARVEQLRKVINMDSLVEDKPIIVEERSPSPFITSHSSVIKPSVQAMKVLTPTPAKLFTVKDSDDDDEDYNYDDVIKSAAEKIKKQKLKEEMDIIKQSLIDSAADTETNAKLEPKPESEPIIIPEEIKPNLKIAKENMDDETALSVMNVLNLVKNSGINLLIPQISQQSVPNQTEPLINYPNVAKTSSPVKAPNMNNEHQMMKNNFRPQSNVPQKPFGYSSFPPQNQGGIRLNLKQHNQPNAREQQFPKPMQFQNNQGMMPNQFNYNNDNNFSSNRNMNNMSNQRNDFPNQFQPGFNNNSNNQNNFGAGMNNYNNSWNPPPINTVAGFPSSSSLGASNQFRNDNKNNRGRGRGNQFHNKMGRNKQR